jgi:hypothetical protein
MVKANLDSTDIGSIAICQLLHRTNSIALVAGGSKPKFADNTVLIWDDAKETLILESNFSSYVLLAKTRRGRLFVCEHQRTHCFDFPQKSQKLFTIKTRDNRLCLCDVMSYTCSDRQLLVFPGHQIGSIQFLGLTTTEPGISSAPLNISAHQTEIACLAINKQWSRPPPRKAL